MNTKVYRYLIGTIIVFLYLQANAQIGVEYFDKLPHNVAAGVENAKTDVNGNKCALLVVQSYFDDLIFFIPDNGICNIEQKDSEWWIFISPLSKNIAFDNSRFGSGNYNFPVQIEEGASYLMKLEVLTGVISIKPSGSRYNDIENLFTVMATASDENDFNNLFINFLNMCTSYQTPVIIKSKSAYSGVTFSETNVRLFLRSLFVNKVYNERIDLIDYDVDGKISRIVLVPK